jgi:hypothetical protein
MLSDVSIIWRQSKDHLMEYFCLNIFGISAKCKHTVKYPNLPVAMKPVLHNEHCPVPRPSGMWSEDH